MITIGKKNTLAARRALLAKLYLNSAVKKILEELAPRYAERKGGYLRIVKLGYRQGDAAKVVKITDFGAFVELTPKQEGLVHVSQLSNKFVKNVEDVVKLGDTIRVKVIRIDEQGKIALSAKT